MSGVSRPPARVRLVSGEVDAKDVATRTVIPSSQLAFWSPFVRVGETLATPRKRFGPHAHEHQEVLIYLIEGAAQHTTPRGRSEELRAGAVLFLCASAPASHAVNPRPGHTARWFSIVAEIPAEGAVTEGVDVSLPSPSPVQPDGTVLTPLLGAGTSFRSRLGTEVVAIEFREGGTAFRRVGAGHRALFYSLAGRGSVDNAPLEGGEAALVENSAAVSLSGSIGFRVVQATVPFSG